MRKEYYPGGRLKKEYTYKDDPQNGTTRKYYESGGIKDIDTYKGGKKTNRKTYGEPGQLLSEQDYPAE